MVYSPGSSWLKLSVTVPCPRTGIVRSDDFGELKILTGPESLNFAISCDVVSKLGPGALKPGSILAMTPLSGQFPVLSRTCTVTAGSSSGTKHQPLERCKHRRPLAPVSVTAF